MPPPVTRSRNSAKAEQDNDDFATSPAKAPKSPKSPKPNGSSKGNAFKFTPEKDKWDGTYEFGGPVGAVSIMVISHLLIYYAFTCIDSWGGELVYPGHPALNGQKLHTALWAKIVERATPSAVGFTTYLIFLGIQWLFAVIMPGPTVLGRAVPSEGGHRHAYRCNGFAAWWTLLAILFALNFSGVWKISTVARNYGTYLTSAIVIGNVTSVLVYAWGLLAGRAVRMTGRLGYDFFMGSCLNPKLPLGVDFKMVAELRVSWAYLFIITLSHAFQMYEEHGRLTNGMMLLLLGHWLYANACHKGEECVTACWDIFYEKFGWLLIFWNLAGVPVFYGVQALFIMKVRPTTDLPTWQFAACACLLLAAYYVFDTAGSQKNRFRMQRDGAPDHVIRRRTFPQLPWGLIEEPRTLTGRGKDAGKELFVDGWFRLARKINYTADSCLAFCWGASCGFGHFLPFLYWTFHFFMLLHRVTRDEHVMAAKYGPMWRDYIKLVPYRFIPYVI